MPDNDNPPVDVAQQCNRATGHSGKHERVRFDYTFPCGAALDPKPVDVAQQGEPEEDDPSDIMFANTFGDWRIEEQQGSYFLIAKHPGGERIVTEFLLKADADAIIADHEGAQEVERLKKELARVSKLWNGVRMGRPADVSGWRAVITEKEQEVERLRAALPFTLKVTTNGGLNPQTSLCWKGDGDAVYDEDLRAEVIKWLALDRTLQEDAG